MGPLLIIDTNYLCHRAYHALGALAHGGAGTGAIYGVLLDIISLQDTFATDRCVFAFDKGPPAKRQDIAPTYKSSRARRHAIESIDDQTARKDFNRQVKLLRTDYLPCAGFNNVFARDGFEADDIIASVAGDIDYYDEAVIIGSDRDLWQCIRRNVWCWNPQKKLGYDIYAFRQQWGIQPQLWYKVKAIAGCTTDDVRGVPGVGEKTAAKWLRGELGEGTKAAKKINNAELLIKHNTRLVKLPFPGTPHFEIVQDNVTEESWRNLAHLLGMNTLLNKLPRAAKRNKRGRKLHGRRTLPK